MTPLQRHKTKAPLAPALVCGLAVLLALLAHVSPVVAVATQTWRQRERGDFDKGDLDKVSLSAGGEIRLSPRLDLLYEARQPYVWALAQDAKGLLFAAGGNEGEIDRVNPAGRGEVFYRVEEPEVHALAVDASGALYAGTAPGGRIYKISSDGKLVWSRPTGEKYVWALVFDRQGTLFAATGVEGRVLKIEASGHASVFFDSAETHIRSLLTDAEGNLLAGTDGHGLVLRISPRGEGAVLYDAPLNEVTALTPGPQGTIYAAVVGESGGRGGRPERPASPPAPSQAPQPSGEGGASPQGAGQPQGTTEGPAPAPPERVPIGMEGKVLAISPDGYARELWSGSQEAILSLVVANDGRLLMGSNQQGAIYALDADGTVGQIARSASSQVTALLRRGVKGTALAGEVAVAGSNFGTVSMLRGGYEPSGAFESRVLDARSFATWGRATWRADRPRETSIEISARSGNTEDPDRTWSDWGPPLALPEGSLVDRPAARFLQWRAVLKTEDPSRTPVLREVAVTYLQRNLPPEIRKVEVPPPGASFQKIPAATAGGPPEGRPGGGDADAGVRRKGRPQSRRSFEPGARSVTWQAVDPNDDDLVYDVYYRAVDETTWKPVRRGIDEDFVTLDGAALPDGTYQFRIVASDAPSNPAGQALSAEKISERFDVDNTPPRVEGIRAQTQAPSLRLAFTVSDTFSLVREVSYSIDAGDWVLARPVDGLNDSTSETYDLTLPSPPAGEHSVVIRATDAAGNVGAGKVVVQVPGRP